MVTSRSHKLHSKSSTESKTFPLSPELEEGHKRALEVIAATQPVPDLKAWGEVVAVMRERARRAGVEKARGWSREDIYEERLSRYPRR